MPEWYGKNLDTVSLPMFFLAEHERGIGIFSQTGWGTRGWTWSTTLFGIGISPERKNKACCGNIEALKLVEKAVKWLRTVAEQGDEKARLCPENDASARDCMMKDNSSLSS